MFSVCATCSRGLGIVLEDYLSFVDAELGWQASGWRVNQRDVLVVKGPE